MNCVDHGELCIVVIPNPDNEDEIWIRETEFPDVVLKTPRKNWEMFIQEVKDGKLDGV